jgi:atypical dual specificity phosphatase
MLGILISDLKFENMHLIFMFCISALKRRLNFTLVIICSLAGMSRSVTVAVSYIMSVTSLNWKEALKVVRVGRAVANPNFGFQKQLQDFETFKLAEVLL